MLNLRDAIQIVRHLGPSWLLRRGLYALRRRLGGLERAMRMTDWSAVESPSLRLSLPPRRCASRNPAEIGPLTRGEFMLFSRRSVEAGMPPNWHRNQLTGEIVPSHVHWSRLGDFCFGDIKGVWELSRFGWAYELVRYGGAEAGGLFWRLFADWMESNPPNRGPNWMCGQEASIRLMAVVFAAERFGIPPDQAAALSRFIVATGQRVRANLNYALSQQNNHGISECVGLLTAALLLETAHPPAVAWRTIALTRLEQQVRALIYADGGFSQHSLIYHRVVLHQLAWAVLRLRSAGLREPRWLSDGGRRITAFLAELTDPSTGEAPLYGANDGTNLLPLCDSEFCDFRPAVQLGAALFHDVLRYVPGPWDEPVEWLVGDPARPPRQSSPLRDWHAPDTGLAQLVRGNDRLVLRCPTHFRHRPSQADFGHVDVWLAGRRVAIDGGSFSYNSSERFAALGLMREHNAVIVDGREPMRKATRFLYVPWPSARLRVNPDGSFTYEAVFAAWPGVGWTRTVDHRTGGGFRVVDMIEGAEGREIRWHWRLVDGPWRRMEGAMRLPSPGCDAVVTWKTAIGAHVEIVRADSKSAAGWVSRHYAQVTPAISLVIRHCGTLRTEATFEFFDD